MSDHPPPGWYPDPSGEHEMRYWDGSGWTARLESSDPPQQSYGASSSGRPPSRRLTGTVVGLLLATVPIYVFSAIAWIGYRVRLGSWLNGSGSSSFDLFEARDLALGVTGLGVLATAITGVLFITWFFQAYESSASRGATQRRWGVGWTIAGWFIPVANAVIPKMVMNEVDRMSASNGPPPIMDRWRRQRPSRLSDLWWPLWVSGWFLVATALSLEADMTFEGSATVIGVAALGSALLAAAAAVAAAFVRELSKRLREPTGESPGLVSSSPLCDL